MRTVVLLFVLASAGCFPSSNDCVPGQSIACTGPAACAGYQVCSADGDSFGSCACGNPPPGGVERPAACDDAEGPSVTVTSAADVQARIVGVWGICGGADEFRARPIELTASGHWFTLVREGSSLVRAQGPYDTGTYTVEPVTTATTMWNVNRPDVGYLLRGILTSSPDGMYLGGGRYAKY